MRGLTFSINNSPSTYSLGFLRWFSTTVPVGSSIPIAGETGDLGDWEFEGNETDSAHGTNFASGTVSYGSTPIYAPNCNAGAQQSFRAGGIGTLDGTGSTPLDGGTSLTYLWQQDTSSSQKLVWSSHSTSGPALTGMVFGPVNINLAVTDGSGQTSTCGVHDGAVATDSSDNVVIADPIVNAILSPLLRYGSPNLPWPWFDTANKYANDWFGALLSGPNSVAGSDGYLAFWATPATGTISVPLTGAGTPAAVTGVGTHFLNDICISGATVLTATATSPITITMSSAIHLLNGDFVTITGATGMSGLNGSWTLHTTGLANSYTLAGSSGSGSYNASSAGLSIKHYIVLWWPHLNGRTGHRYAQVSSCSSDTILTATQPYYNYASQVDLTSNSGNIAASQYAIANESLLGTWTGQSSNANYYMQDLGYLLTYYRTGIVDYLNYFNTLAPRWFQSYGLDWGTTTDGVAGFWAPPYRTMALIGPMLYAYLTDSTYWPQLYTILDYLYSVEPASGPIGDMREESAANAYLAVASYMYYAGAPGTDGMRASTYAVGLATNLNGRWLPNQRTHKEWVAENCGQSSWCGGGFATVPALGGTSVTLAGQTYNCTTPDALNHNDRIWFTDDPTHFTLAAGDSTSYTFTCSGAATTALTLTAPYAGAQSGSSKGFLIGGVMGQPTQPFMMGYTGAAFQLEYVALNAALLAGNGGIDPSDPGKARQFVQDTAAWNLNSSYGGMRAFTNGLWYLRNGLVASPAEPCEPPESTDPWSYSQNIFLCSGDVETGTLSAASNAVAAILSCPVACGVSPGDPVHFADATGSWTPLNNTFTALSGSGSTFAIPLDSTAFGPFTGNVVFANRNNAGGAIQSSRFLAAETHRSMAQACLFMVDCSALKTTFDCMFGGMWGGPNQVGICADSNYLTDYNPVGSFDYGRNYAKINGFSFGWGAGAQWPSARQGGVSAPIARTLEVGFNLTPITNATKARVTLTKPDGTTVTATCTTSPCSIVADAREANHLLLIEYLSAGNAVLAARPVALPVGVQ